MDSFSHQKPGVPTVLFQDESFLVIDKPSGLSVHRGWSRESKVLTDWVRDCTGAKKAYPVHRIDRGASGTILFAADSAMARVLAGMQERGEVEKHYLALVRGRPPETGKVDHPIPRRSGGPRVPAVTEFWRLATANCKPRNISLVEAVPRTGRLHQVRRHLKHVSHPLIGDANYGKGALNRAIKSEYGLARLALHAFRLSLTHPISGAKIQITAQLPGDLTDPMLKMGFNPDLWNGYMAD